MAQPIEEIVRLREEKLSKLKSLGINPYPSKFSADSMPVSTAVNNLEKKVCVRGRLVSWREHGATIFADLKDTSGQIQIWFQKEKLAQNFAILKLLDIGDFLGVCGQVTKTKAGQTTIDVDNFELLSKALRPIPDGWYGLKDEETRYRKRYLDLLLNDDLKNLFQKKAVFWQSMREFLISKNFLEVETPVLEATAGGADATPFVTHHNALDTDFYLRISMGELWQKRLMVAGFEKTFEIGRQFRNEGISREHLQDYTQMEFYWAYANFQDSMKLVEEMYKHVIQKTFGKFDFEINDFKVDFSKEWEIIDYSKTIKEKTGVDVITLKNPREMDGLWKKARKNIAGPAFLTGHPVVVSPLAKRQEKNPEFVERYQVIIAGSELGNGYSELNDPLDQAQRFSDQQALREKGDAEAQMNDIDFVTALEYGMPPVSGFGVSERLFSFLCNLPIRETVLFPLLRPENGVSKKSNPANSTENFELPAEQKDIFYISSDVKNKFPGMKAAAAIIENVEIHKGSKELDKLKEEVLNNLGEITLADIDKLSTIVAYRKIFKEFGVDWHSRHPSADALLRRIALGKGIYNINTLVDAYNLAVLDSKIALGAFDLGKISLPTTLRLAKNGEKALLLGETENTGIDEGEMVYSDTQRIMTLDLNYRDGDYTKVSTDAKSIILFADGTPDISSENVLRGLEKGIEYITRFCGGEVKIKFIAS